MTDVLSLKKKEPRAGKRLPIHDSENEEEKTNEKQVKLQAQAVQLEENKAEEEKVQKKEKEEVVTAAVTAMLQQNNVPLINTNDRARAGNMDLVQIGTGGKKGEEGKTEGTRKKYIKKKCRTILLNNNEIRSIDGLLPTLSLVMREPERLIWLDLSFNYLEHIEPEILCFPELKTLYLHGNYIYEMKDVKKLADLPQLLTLTLHGNPIEQISGYRLFVLGIIYSKNERLKKLDSVVVTRKEQENVYVWDQVLNGKKKAYPELEKSKIKKPPKKEDENKNTDKKKD